MRTLTLSNPRDRPRNFQKQISCKSQVHASNPFVNIEIECLTLQLGHALSASHRGLVHLHYFESIDNMEGQAQMLKKNCFGEKCPYVQQ